MYQLVHDGRIRMTPSDRIVLPLLGVAFWIAGTVFYEFRGHQVFEGGAPRYWVNFILTPAITTVVCILILKVRHIPLLIGQWPGSSSRCQACLARLFFCRALPSGCRACIRRAPADTDRFSSPPMPCS